MDYTQPMVYKINAFDVNSQSTIPQLQVGFTGLESAPSTINCIADVYNNDTGNEVVSGGIDAILELQSTSNGLSLYNVYYRNDYVPPVKTNILEIFSSDLVNSNSYYITITLPIEVTEGDPIISNSVVFSCYSTPEFYNFNISNDDIIRQSALKLDFDYRQDNNVELNWYQCDLYNSGNNELVESSGKLYDENYIYTFNNLTNNVNYYIIVFGSTIDNFNFESTKINFSVSYQVIPDSTIIKLQNIPEEGYIKVNSNFNLIPGTINNAELEDGIINLKNTNSNVIWDNGLDINYNPLTLKVWGRDFINNKKIVDITNSENINEFINITSSVGNLGNQTIGGNIKLNGSNISYISRTVKVNGMYFGIYENTGLEYVVYSLDLVNWYYIQENDSLGSEITTSSSGLGKWMLGYVNGYYYIRGSSYGIWYSANGIDGWTEVQLGNLLPNSLIYDGTYYRLFGWNGSAYSSNYDFSDATINSGTSYVKNNVAYINGKYIGADYNDRLCYSLDGVTWNLCTDENGANIDVINSGNIDIIYYNNKFILFYPNQGLVNTYNSDNGINWVKGNSVSHVAYYQSRFFGKLITTTNYLLYIGWNNNIQRYEVNYSYDGLNWNLLFNTTIGAYILGMPATEIINNSLHINTNVENTFDFTYDSIEFTINAKGINNNTIISATNSPALSNVYFYDWLYIGAQIILDSIDNDIVQSVTINVQNQNNTPGGA